jgi:hypothetical protein
MTDEQKTSSEGSQTASGEAWREVGRQFEALGESLAAAFKTAWQNEENRQQLREARASLEAMAERVGQTVKEVAASPDAQKARDEVKKVAQSAQVAGEQTLREVQPHLLVALRQIKTEIDKMIDHLEQETPAAETTSDQEDTSPQI